MTLRLIPKMESSHDRKTLCQQIRSVRVSLAARIFENYTLKGADFEIEGRPCRSDILWSATGDQLQIFVASQYRSPLHCPTAAIVDLISECCEIKDRRRLNLLWIVFTQTDLDRVNQAFAKQGIHIFRNQSKASPPFLNSRSRSLCFRLGNSGALPKANMYADAHAYTVPDVHAHAHARIRSLDSIDVPLLPDGYDSHRGSGSRGTRYVRNSGNSHEGKRLPPDIHNRRLPVLFPSDEVGEKESKHDSTDTDLDLEFLGERLVSRIIGTIGLNCHLLSC